MSDHLPLFGLCREEGMMVDRLLRDLAEAARAVGRPVAGYVQERRRAPDCGCPGIVLHDLASGAAHDVSEQRGPGASGCNLDWAALTDRAAALERAVAQTSPALVIVSRFGKAEADGRGFCGVIEACLDRAIPVVVAYRADFAPVWSGYHGGLARGLSGRDARAILAEIDALADTPG